MDHADYQNMLPARALDALDAEELRALDEHVATCIECRTELVGWRDDAGLLAFGAPAVDPRAELGTRIMDRVRDASAHVTEPPANVVPMPERRVKATPVWLRLAAAIAFLALMIGIVVLWGRNARLQRDVVRLTNEVDTQQHALVRDRAIRQREREALALLTAPDAKRTELAGTTAAKDARATFAFDRQSGRAVLMTVGLPMAPAGKAYELWFIANGRPMPGKMFTVDESGRAMMADQVPPEAREKAVFAITLEPEAGVSTPTGAIYLSSPGL